MSATLQFGWNVSNDWWFVLAFPCVTQQHDWFFCVSRGHDGFSVSSCHLLKSGGDSSGSTGQHFLQLSDPMKICMHLAHSNKKWMARNTKQLWCGQQNSQHRTNQELEETFMVLFCIKCWGCPLWAQFLQAPKMRLKGFFALLINLCEWVYRNMIMKGHRGV